MDSSSKLVVDEISRDNLPIMLSNNKTKVIKFRFENNSYFDNRNNTKQT